MPITDLLERNSKLYGEEVALIEINPEIHENARVTWKEYSLIQPTSSTYYGATSPGPSLMKRPTAWRTSCRGAASVRGKRWRFSS